LKSADISPSTTGRVVRVLELGDAQWEALESDDRFSVYHRRDWIALVERVFGHRAMFVAALEDNRVIDALPLFMVRFPGLGSKIVSTPYDGCYGGFAADDHHVHNDLIRTAIRLAKESRARFVEIRSQTPVAGLTGAGFIEHKPLLITELELIGIDENFKRFSTGHRRNVRYAEKRGVTTSKAQKPEDMRKFFTLLRMHYKDLGIPFFSQKFFDEIWNSLIEKETAVLHLASVGDETIGGHLMFKSGTALISKYAAYSKQARYRNKYVSYALYWEAIRFGIEHGFSLFNMGVTGRENTGLLDFKNRFGARTREVSFYYYPIRGQVPDYSELYHGFQFAKKVWRWAPSTITSYLGHWVNKWFC
jgi:CelD/BcsL family acetyltransferase involved in cellulose biosynthesis